MPHASPCTRTHCPQIKITTVEDLTIERHQIGFLTDEHFTPKQQATSQFSTNYFQQRLLLFAAIFTSHVCINKRIGQYPLFFIYKILNQAFYTGLV